MASGSIHGYRDYDQICLDRQTLLFDQLERACDDNRGSRTDGLPLPYSEEFGYRHVATTNFGTDLAKLLYEDRSNPSAVSDMRHGLLIGTVILDKMQGEGDRISFDLTTIRGMVTPGRQQAAKLFDTTDRYRQVRPQLNRFVDRYLPEACAEQHRQGGIAAANLVLWQSEERHYKDFQTQLEMWDKELNGITTYNDFVAMCRKTGS